MDDAKAEALLTGLVQRHSPSMHEGPAVDYLVEQMGQLGFEARIDPLHTSSTRA